MTQKSAGKPSILRALRDPRFFSGPMKRYSAAFERIFSHEKRLEGRPGCKSCTKARVKRHVEDQAVKTFIGIAQICAPNASFAGHMHAYFGCERLILRISKGNKETIVEI